MWERAEDELRIPERRGLGSHEGHRAEPADVHLVAAPLVRGSPCQREARMPPHERAELAPGIPACAQNPDRDFMHR